MDIKKLIEEQVKKELALTEESINRRDQRDVESKLSSVIKLISELENFFWDFNGRIVSEIVGIDLSTLDELTETKAFKALKRASDKIESTLEDTKEMIQDLKDEVVDL